MTNYLTPICGVDDTAASSTATNYNYLTSGHSSSWSATENTRAVVVPGAFTISNLCVWSEFLLSAGQSIQYTVMKNGAATGLTVTVNNTVQIAHDDVNSVSVVAGDRLSLRSVPTGTPTMPSNVLWYCRATSTDGSTPNMTAVISHSNSTTGYMPPGTGQANTASNATELNSQIVIPTPGTISKLYVYSNTAPGGTTPAYAFTLMKNGVAAALTATMTGAATTASDTTNSVSVVAGDTITMRIVPSGTPAISTNIAFGFIFTPTTLGESFLGFGNSSNPSTTAQQYEGTIGMGKNAWATTEFGREIMPGTCTLKKLYVKLSAAPGTSKSREVAVRKEGLTTALDLTITGAATTGNIAVDVAVASEEHIALMTAPTGTPTVGHVHTGYLFYIAPVAGGASPTLPIPQVTSF